MAMYELPTALEVCGVLYAIRSDYRAALDICTALSDPELSDREKAWTALVIMYPDLADMPEEHYQDALQQCCWFISGGDEEKGQKKAPRLMDWEQDFRLIVAPVNRVIGQEVRALAYLHWWTFISAYYEIGGDCTFAQIVRIRSQLSKGKSLDKTDREWYRQHRALVDLRAAYTDEDDEVLGVWVGR